MKKTSVYLEPGLDRALQRTADRKGITKAELIRRSLSEAVLESRPRLSGIGIGEGPGDVADDVDRHLAETGFGET